MLAEIASLKTQVSFLTKMIEKQDLVLERQNIVLQELQAMANQGRGSLWMFLALGSIVGAIITNFHSFVNLFKS